LCFELGYDDGNEKKKKKGDKIQFFFFVYWGEGYKINDRVVSMIKLKL
jgi:hypothetical protein